MRQTESSSSLNSSTTTEGTEMTNQLAEAFPAGEFLAEELEARSWTQSEFAEILGRPTQFVSEIISGKKEITRDSAVQIAAALGTSAEYWLNLQNSYLLWAQRKNERIQSQLEDVRLRARLQELAPISTLERRGLIRGGSLAVQRKQLEALFEVNDIFDEPELLIAARRANPDEPVANTQLAWAACARRLADRVDVAKYEAEGFEAVCTRLSGMAQKPAGFRKFPTAFADVGVRLVYLEALPSSKIDGCSLIHRDGGPVICISGRGKRLDKVLYTILHEAAHIFLGHLDKQPYIVDDQERRPTLGLEDEADALASEWILPAPLPRVPGRVSAPWIDSEADAIGIHPIVLIGRLQNAGRLPWRTTLVKGAPTVTEYLETW